MKEKKEEIFEASLTPEALERTRTNPIVTGKGPVQGVSAYGPLEQSVAAMKEPVFDNERMWSLLRGSYDVHQHSGPSSTTQRLYDEIDCAIQGCEVEQGGIVFKNHDTPTTRSVRLVQRVVDEWAEEHHKKKIELFGGVVLNYSVGGLNPAAVIAAYRLGGKYVWMPNLDASHHRKKVGQGEGKGIDVIDENDNVVPKMKEILALMAETDMVLGVGHQSTKERLIVIREAVKMGVQRIEINHVNSSFSYMTPEQLKMAADMGAYIGVYGQSLALPAFSWDYTWEAYKTVGPERIVFASDCGYVAHNRPTESMRRLILRFLFEGVPDKEVELMCRTNAYNLLH